MKLSDAIRLGSLLHPQGFGSCRVYGYAEQIIGTCALGAAIEAGLAIDHVAYSPQIACPVCRAVGVMLGMVPHLNDSHRWTRERIADWVATVEPQEPSVTTDAASDRVDALPVADAPRDSYVLVRR